MAGRAAGAARRSGEQVREALIAAASAEFAQHGYTGAKMRRIANRAKTSESGLARHFTTKEDLFTSAVLQPFITFIDHFTAQFSALLQLPSNDPTLFSVSTNLLYSQVETHRDSVMALLAASRDPDAQSVFLLAADRMNTWFGEMYELSERFYDRYGNFDAPNSVLWPGLFAAMIVCVATFEPLFVPHGRVRPDRDVLLRTMSDLWARGIMGSLPLSLGTGPDCSP